jgi:beta-lactamase regulating signal transducer with metallopeptidase domain
MTTLIRCYPGDGVLDFLLAVILGVALASSTAWFISRRLAGKAALRHVVLSSALLCCLASPAVAWFCHAGGLTLVSLPMLRAEQERIASVIPTCGPDPVGVPAGQCIDPSAAATGVPLTNASKSTPTNTTFGRSADVGLCCPVEQGPATLTPSKSDSPSIGSPAATSLSFHGIATVAMFVWAAGGLLMLARLARNCGRVVLLRRASRAAQSERLETLLHETAARLAARHIPLLLVSSRTIVPLGVGFGRSAVILPERLLGAVSDIELRDVLMHELAHLERGHQWTVLLQELAAAMYWPIVSVHGINRELRRTCEEVCDNVVLASRDAISYGETLLHVAELSIDARPIRAAVAIVGGQGELERRIAGLIDPKRNTTTKTGRKASFLILFLFVAVGVLLSATRFAASAAVEIENLQCPTQAQFLQPRPIPICLPIRG